MVTYIYMPGSISQQPSDANRLHFSNLLWIDRALHQCSACRWNINTYLLFLWWPYLNWIRSECGSDLSKSTTTCESSHHLTNNHWKSANKHWNNQAANRRPVFWQLTLQCPHSGPQVQDSINSGVPSPDTHFMVPCHSYYGWSWTRVHFSKFVTSGQCLQC